MGLIIDLVESRLWLTGHSVWPKWLDADWVAAREARFICKLSKPDDLSGIRAMLPDPGRLLAYPDYPNLKQQLTPKAHFAVQQTFLYCLGADRYLQLAPGASEDDLPVPSPLIGTTVATRPHLPRLALVSPMPPVTSGIANYCDEILPALAQYYEITLVVEDPGGVESQLAERFELLSHTEFLSCGARYDRVMYHFGNSSLHYDYFTLLMARPGVVVLHDIYMGDCIFSNYSQMGIAELRQQIYRSHGWPALADCEETVQQSIGLYPACAALFSDSYGVAVHSQFARDNLALFFDRDVLDDLHVILLARKIKTLPPRDESRVALSIPASTLVYATFGLLNPNKCLVDLVEAWGASALATDTNAILCLVGGCGDRELEQRIRKAISRLPRPEQIVLTGFVDNSMYDKYLGATDVAIQLRRNSRGESSAALLDCMAAGIPTIINAHGSMAEMPDDTVIKIADEFSLGELAGALEFSHAQPDALARTGEVAQAFVLEHHSVEHTAARYSRHIEQCYAQNMEVVVNATRGDVLAPHIRDAEPHSLWACVEEYDDLMRSTGALHSTLAGAQLLVDVSGFMHGNPMDGPPLEMRSILRALLNDPYLGCRVEPVYYDFDAGLFRYARTFINAFLALSPLYLNDDPVEAAPGDIYLGLDPDYRVAGDAQSRRWLQFWRGRGVRVHHVLCELASPIPPSAGLPDQAPALEKWLRAITDISDGVVTVSRELADEYRNWLQHSEVIGASRPKIAYFNPAAESQPHQSGDASRRDSASQLLDSVLRGQWYEN